MFPKLNCLHTACHIWADKDEHKDERTMALEMQFICRLIYPFFRGNWFKNSFNLEWALKHADKSSVTTLFSELPPRRCFIVGWQSFYYIINIKLGQMGSLLSSTPFKSVTVWTEYNTIAGELSSHHPDLLSATERHWRAVSRWFISFYYPISWNRPASFVVCDSNKRKILNWAFRPAYPCVSMPGVNICPSPSP